MSKSQISDIKQTLSRYFGPLLVFILFSRLLLMAVIPLNDTTEARYGEIARKMVETNNWVTLFHDYSVPFWAKPPLSTWTSAFSAKLLGMSEFALRLPSFLLSLGILALVWGFAKRTMSKTAAQLVVIILASAIFFFIDAGTVMTDPSLLFTSTLAMVAFWYRLQDAQLYWGYLFFVALGLGLLAKGPLILVLAGMPIFFWTLYFKKWGQLWQKLPWLTGTLLMLLIALPWYLLAEHRTPGFIKYFIVGEHFGRYLSSGWMGDKYGFAHSAPLGMIWVYTFIGFMPWSFYFIVGYIRERRQMKSQIKAYSELLSYLLLWVLCPLLFFTFSRNIIYTYAFTVLPALALLLTLLWSNLFTKAMDLVWVIILTVLVGLSSFLIAAINQIDPAITNHSEKSIVQLCHQQRKGSECRLIYWAYSRKFSAEFYTAGKVSYVSTIPSLQEAMASHPKAELVINEIDLPRLPKPLLAKLTLVSSVKIGNDTRMVFTY